MAARTKMVDLLTVGRAGDVSPFALFGKHQMVLGPPCHQHSQTKKECIGRGVYLACQEGYTWSLRLRGLLQEAFELLDHPYKVGEGLRVHLLHCAAALNLHGIFRGSELTSNLLIEHA